MILVFASRALVLLLASTLLSCYASNRCGMDFPDQVPPNLTIRMNSNGGMLPQWEDVSFSRDSIVIVRFFEGAEARLVAAGDTLVMRRLWRSFVDNHFETIDTYTEDVYDRGGLTLSLSNDGRTCSVSDAGRTLIVKPHVDRWERIVMAVLAERDDIVGRLGVPVDLTIDSTFDNRRVSFQIGWVAFATDSLVRVPRSGLKITRRIVPGPQVMRANVNLEQWGERRATVTSHCNIRLSLREGKPIIEVE